MAVGLVASCDRIFPYSSWRSHAADSSREPAAGDHSPLDAVLDGRAPDKAKREAGNTRDQSMFADRAVFKDNAPPKPDKALKDQNLCVASCEGVCGANDGCGGTCYSDHALDACSQVDVWRCVMSYYWKKPISQVCKLGTWWTYNIGPKDCNGCCGSYSDACSTN